MSKFKQQHKDHVTIVEFQVGNAITKQSLELAETYSTTKNEKIAKHKTSSFA
jgi:hypothetical protein